MRVIIRLLGRDEVSYDWQHYIPLLEKKPGALRNGAPFAEMPLLLAQLQTALRRRERQQGDRIMAKVLAAVPAHGLETVLGAVKQLLDSGVTSIEQVLNVLSRLNDLPIPAQVETSLKLNEEPLADTARYDSLNDQRGVPCLTSSVNSRHSNCTVWRNATPKYRLRTGPELIDSVALLLRQLLEAEATDRSIRTIRYQMGSAKFPIHRDFLGFDFGQSIVDQSLINKLATMKFTDAAQNLVLVGGTGTGKTHLSTATWRLWHPESQQKSALLLHR